MDIDLGGGEADAGRVVHGFQHVRGQFAQCGVDFGHGFRDLAQPGIGEFQNCQNRHKLVTAF